jgi:hypothetical protein
MFRSWLALLMLAAASAHAAALTEESCSVLAGKTGEKPDLRDVPGLSVMSLRPDNPLVMKAADGIAISGIVCWRSEARLVENDYLVLDAGFPLYIKAEFDDESRNRTLALERSGGTFRVRLLDGPALTGQEQGDFQNMIALYDAKVRDRSAATRGAQPEPLPPLSPDAPADRPHAVYDENELHAYEQAIAPYVAKAKETWPDAKRRFLAGLPPHHIFSVTTRLYDAQGHAEFVFVRVQWIKDGIISGQIATQLELIRAYKPGDPYSFREENLLDWTISRPDGTEEGNVVGKFLDTYQAARQEQ